MMMDKEMVLTEKQIKQLQRSERVNPKRTHDTMQQELFENKHTITKLQAENQQLKDLSIRNLPALAKKIHSEQAEQLELQKTAGEQLGRMLNESNEQNKNCRKRLSEQAEQIAALKRHRHLVNEECQGYVVLNDGLQAENQRLKEILFTFLDEESIKRALKAAQPQGGSDE